MRSRRGLRGCGGGVGRAVESAEDMNREGEPLMDTNAHEGVGGYGRVKHERMVYRLAWGGEE